LGVAELLPCPAYRRSTVRMISGGAGPGMVSGWLVRWWMRTTPKLGRVLVQTRQAALCGRLPTGRVRNGPVSC
jgi:hypothetical protein